MFSPGLGCPAQMYENFIEELVSHGYIVIGINSLFISGDIALPNARIVKYNHKYDDDTGKFDNELMQITSSDFSLLFEQIHEMHDLNPIFKAMDLNNIGALGHSIGGNVVANVTHVHTNWFRAAATLDIGYDLSGDSLKSFVIPFIHLISSKMKDRVPTPIFEMAKTGYVAGISPDENNRSYSYHMNFTDQSTLQFLPAYQTLMWWLTITGQEKNIPVGKGNGWEITHSINTYLVQFFNTFIKNELNPAFSNCSKLSSDTFIKCGPAIY